MDLDFTNTPDIDADLLTFQLWFNANLPTVDKAVLMTYYDYFSPTGGNLYGSVRTIPGDVAIVEVRTGHPDWITAHEVGHLYGGRHDDASSIFCGRAYRSGSTATPVAATATPHIRVNYYSDPATFGSSTRWNAGIIQNHWCGAL